MDSEFVETILKGNKLSQQDVKMMVSNFKKKFGKNCVEPGIAKTIFDKTHLLDSYFDVTERSFDNETITHTLVYSHKLNDLVAFVLGYRNCDDEFILKIGIDGGSGSLKVCLSIQEYSPHISSSYKDGGIMKLLILAAAFNVDESYENLKIIFETLNLQNLLAYFPNKFVIVGDLKIINMILGKDSSN